MNNSCKISFDQLYKRLLSEISSLECRTISLERLHSIAQSANNDMPVYLQSPEGQAVFQDCLKKLVSEQLLSPVGKKPATTQGLHLKYKINNESGKKEPALTSDIIRSIIPPASVDYYLRNPQDYWTDRGIIEILCDFLKQKNVAPLTVNERAYQLFGDEKFFRGDSRSRSRGETVLKRLGLDYQSIGCLETPEPFFSFLSQDFHSQAGRDIYIIENKDTFWSFKRTLMDPPSGLKVDMLIYGEGKKIISSFRFVQEYGIDPQRDRFFYFGDLDPEGINIYCELVAEYPQYIINPFRPAYQAVLEIGLARDPVKTPKEQRISKGNFAQFIEALEKSACCPDGSEISNFIKLKKHLESGFYIPQEALSAAEMKERFGNS